MTAWRLRIARGVDEPHDVAVLAETSSSAADLAIELEASGYRGREASVNGRPLSAAETVGELDLAHGDTILLDGAPDHRAIRAPGSYLAVAAGPDAGAFIRLERDGPFVVGRKPDCDLTLDDDLVSSEHFRLNVEAGRASSITDLGSSNGTLVDGQVIREHGPVEPGVAISCGTTVLCVVEVLNDDLPVIAAARDGARAFPRRFREALDPIPDRIRKPKSFDEARASSRSSWWRPILPVISGVGLAAITNNWFFLAVVALAPIIMFVESLRRRRVEDRETDEKRREAEAALTAFEQRQLAILHSERLRRRWLAPIAGVACLHAGLRTRRVWERSPSDDDFCSVPVGLATLPTNLRIDRDDDADPAPLHLVPVDVPLLATGSIAVLGPLERGQAAVRGMLMTLATMHSPTDVQVWILTEESRAAGWAFARWLPHCFFESHGARIAQSPADRTRLLNLLDQILSNRREQQRPDSSIALPVHLVVLDGAEVASGPDVARLLQDGRAHGVIGITLDPVVVPEGTAGTVRLGDLADEATFESRLQPRVRDLVLPELSLSTASRAARSLAGLRPAGAGRAAEDSANVILLEQLGLQNLDAGDVLTRWQDVGPTTAVLVGSSAGSPMTVDLVRQGPHGLVGGTTRSGKTEFLKSLFAALALSNSPDQLAILIVDFKGGVDHDQSSQLPHVLSLSTNDDLEGFARTVSLIVAELNRRQRVFRDVGAANLDIYEQVRVQRPDLPPIPRLLVVVDEFSELLGSESGREHLKTLESVTRIGGGLGLHLLLVTQNFQNQLPDQIAANAGLRICFRVQDPAHSKTVLASGIASTLPQSRPGRAYARFHGGDLVEFQSSRVANRQTRLAAGSAPVRVVPVPLGAVATTSVEVRRDDVPAPETDFALIIEAVREASRRIGWTRSAIPWLEDLPERVQLTDVLRARRDGRPVLGLVDRPDLMTQPTLQLDEGMEQVLLVGGPQSGVTDVLVTCAASLALGGPPSDVHLYGIDLLDGALAPLVDLPHCGGVAVRDEGLALKILRRALDETATRRALFASEGVSDIRDLRHRGRELPAFVVFVNGADRMLTQAESGVSPLLAPMLKLLAESPGTGIRVVVSGSASVAHHRVGASIPTRFVLRIPEEHEYGTLGVPRGLVTELACPGRAVHTQTDQLVQFATLSGDGVATSDVICALGAALWELQGPVAAGPRPVVDVKWPLPVDQIDRDALDPPPVMPAALPFGIEVDTGTYHWLDAVDDGPVFGIAGAPKSGRTTALLTIAEDARSLGWLIVAASASRRSPLLQDPSRFDHVVSLGEVGLVLPERPRGRVLVVLDDAHRVAVDDLGLGDWLASDEPTALLVAGPPEFLSGKTKFLRSLPDIRAGIVLAARSGSDGLAFGLKRLPDGALVDPRPGRGLAAVGGEATEIQIPFDPSSVVSS